MIFKATISATTRITMTRGRSIAESLTIDMLSETSPSRITEKPKNIRHQLPNKISNLIHVNSLSTEPPYTKDIN
ncbi:hypothetical protein [Lactobacillus buchneri]|uniref:hypothetical protein n=1 Tax=Lentilactobacillus buchneri TaxID=1581 RepID=UPI0006EFE31B|nr:hypothetical protein FC79_GL000335 [Lentilactobacillus buchneri DSM 20057]